jgi:hypothetical protein
VTEAAAHGCVTVAGGARPGLSCKAQNNQEDKGDEHWMMIQRFTFFHLREHPSHRARVTVLIYTPSSNI